MAATTPESGTASTIPTKFEIPGSFSSTPGSTAYQTPATEFPNDGDGNVGMVAEIENSQGFEDDNGGEKMGSMSDLESGGESSATTTTARPKRARQHGVDEVPGVSHSPPLSPSPPPLPPIPIVAPTQSHQRPASTGVRSPAPPSAEEIIAAINTKLPSPTLSLHIPQPDPPSVKFLDDRPDTVLVQGPNPDLKVTSSFAVEDPSTPGTVTPGISGGGGGVPLTDDNNPASDSAQLPVTSSHVQSDIEQENHQSPPVSAMEINKNDQTASPPLEKQASEPKAVPFPPYDAIIDDGEDQATNEPLSGEPKRASEVSNEVSIETRLPEVPQSSVSPTPAPRRSISTKRKNPIPASNLSLSPLDLESIVPALLPSSGGKALPADVRSGTQIGIERSSSKKVKPPGHRMKSSSTPKYIYRGTVPAPTPTGIAPMTPVNSGADQREGEVGGNGDASYMELPPPVPEKDAERRLGLSVAKHDAEGLAREAWWSLGGFDGGGISDVASRTRAINHILANGLQSHFNDDDAYPNSSQQSGDKVNNNYKPIPKTKDSPLPPLPKAEPLPSVHFSNRNNANSKDNNKSPERPYTRGKDAAIPGNNVAEYQTQSSRRRHKNSSVRKEKDRETISSTQQMEENLDNEHQHHQHRRPSMGLPLPSTVTTTTSISAAATEGRRPSLGGSGIPVPVPVPVPDPNNLAHIHSTLPIQETNTTTKTATATTATRNNKISNNINNTIVDSAPPAQPDTSYEAPITINQSTTRREPYSTLRLRYPSSHTATVDIQQQRQQRTRNRGEIETGNGDDYDVNFSDPTLALGQQRSTIIRATHGGISLELELEDGCVSTIETRSCSQSGGRAIIGGNAGGRGGAYGMTVTVRPPLTAPVYDEVSGRRLSRHKNLKKEKDKGKGKDKQKGMDGVHDADDDDDDDDGDIGVAVANEGSNIDHYHAGHHGNNHGVFHASPPSAEARAKSQSPSSGVMNILKTTPTKPKTVRRTEKLDDLRHGSPVSASGASVKSLDLQQQRPIRVVSGGSAGGGSWRGSGSHTHPTFRRSTGRQEEEQDELEEELEEEEEEEGEDEEDNRDSGIQMRSRRKKTKTKRGSMTNGNTYGPGANGHITKEAKVPVVSGVGSVGGWI